MSCCEYWVNEYGCWVWLLSFNDSGYPLARDEQGKRVYAHRLYWQRANHLFLPTRVQLDHNCRMIKCVRPAHLEPVTASENLKRRNPRYRLLHVKHCQQGHELEQTGLATPQGGMVCRVCSEV